MYTLLFMACSHDRYRQPTGQNATGLARRFNSLAGLKLILVQELEAIQGARTGALQPLDELASACAQLSDQLVQQVCCCVTCRQSMFVLPLACIRPMQFTFLSGPVNCAWRKVVVSLQQVMCLFHGRHVKPLEAHCEPLSAWVLLLCPGIITKC